MSDKDKLVNLLSSFGLIRGPIDSNGFVRIDYAIINNTVILNNGVSGGDYHLFCFDNQGNFIRHESYKPGTLFKNLNFFERHNL